MICDCNKCNSPSFTKRSSANATPGPWSNSELCGTETRASWRGGGWKYVLLTIAQDRGFYCLCESPAKRFVGLAMDSRSNALTCNDHENEICSLERPRILPLLSLDCVYLAEVHLWPWIGSVHCQKQVNEEKLCYCNFKYYTRETAAVSLFSKTAMSQGVDHNLCITMSSCCCNSPHYMSLL